MPDALKQVFNHTMVSNLANKLEQQGAEFDRAAFLRYAIDDQWEQRELKSRMRHISLSMGRFLPQDYAKALDILQAVSVHFSDLPHMVFPDFVEYYGINHFDLSMRALALFTQNSSSEFAVRPFIVQYPQKTMTQMRCWATDSNEHLRRLASEGCRPRLPWAMALPAFKRDPRPVMDILTLLLNDQSEYVRRSVANNLNDISKDNPQVLIELLHLRLGESFNTDWILKHASRSLLKSGSTEVLQVFGYRSPDHIKLQQFTVDKSLSLGDAVNFSFSLSSGNKALGKIRLEYAIDFLLKNGKHGRKVFKISEFTGEVPRRQFSKKHSFKPITTRTYNPGKHHLSIIVNGTVLGTKPFILRI